MPGVADTPGYMSVLKALLNDALEAQNKANDYTDKDNFSTRLDAPLRLTLKGSEITVPVGTEVTFWKGNTPSFCTIFDRSSERQLTVQRGGGLVYRKVPNYNGTPAS